jgi:hypothetical protein
MTKYLWCIASTKYFEVTRQHEIRIDSKSYHFVLNTQKLNFPRDCSVCKHRMWQLVWNILKLFLQLPRIITWHMCKSHVVLTSLPFFYIFQNVQPQVYGRVSWTRCSKFTFVSNVHSQTRMGNMNIIFQVSFPNFWVTCSSNLVSFKILKEMLLIN